MKIEDEHNCISGALTTSSGIALVHISGDRRASTKVKPLKIASSPSCTWLMMSTNLLSFSLTSCVEQPA